MDNKPQNIAKWKTESLNVDIETGLLISKRLREREYIIIRKIKKYEIYGNYGIRKLINECKRNNQLQLF